MSDNLTKGLWEDSKPERRNLNILSTLIILYYLAEAKIGTKISLPIVEITFKNTTALIYFIWILLAWYLIRFIQVTKGHYKTSLGKYIKSYRNSRIIEWYVKSKLGYKKAELQAFDGINYLKEKTFYDARFSYKDESKPKYIITVPDPDKPYDKEEGFFSIETVGDRVMGWQGKLIDIWFKLSFWIKSDAFTSYKIPKYLAYAAILLGIYNVCY
ncbi:MAG: hypothetical protein OEZ58_03105 [Gammaproteobacteria bacterium]|nr:hypothetical protein [Gammaproteobacteria bacterium]MDH5727951.1 hypothetical protein [Gammaproteobacteria bacterium]